MAGEGEVAEIEAIRREIGARPKILVDLHWRYTASEAIQLIDRLCQYDLHLAEAPVAPEDLAGQARVARAVRTQIGLGEEWRTVHEYLPRLQAGCMNVIQPEIAHTGITGFRRICELSQAFHCSVMPHATINVGVAQAASLHVAATLANFVMHEYQHSIFDRNKRFHPQRNGLPGRLLYLAGRAGAWRRTDRGGVALYDRAELTLRSRHHATTRVRSRR